MFDFSLPIHDNGIFEDSIVPSVEIPKVYGKGSSCFFVKCHSENTVSLQGIGRVKSFCVCLCPMKERFSLKTSFTFTQAKIREEEKVGLKSILRKFFWENGPSFGNWIQLFLNG